MSEPHVAAEAIASMYMDSTALRTVQQELGVPALAICDSGYTREPGCLESDTHRRKVVGKLMAVVPEYAVYADHR
jgi:hypothetical protein